MKRVISTILACLMIVSALAGCAGGGGKSGGTLNYVTMWNEGEPATNFLKEVIADFEQETGIKVTLTPAGRDILTKIKSDLLMKNPPDLIDQDFSELNAALLQSGETLVMPLNDFVKSEGPEGTGTMGDIFAEGHLDLFASEGNVYFIPYNLVTSGFFYDKTLFGKYNLTAPATWDDFIKVNETLKQNGVAPLALDGTIAFYNAYYYYWTVQRVMGAGAFSAAAHDKTGAAWDDPGYLKAAELVYELSAGDKDFFQDGYEGSAYPAAQADWAQGKAGSVLCGTWIPNETQPQAAAGFDFGFYAFPEVAGGVGKLTDMEAYLIGYAIPKDAKNAENAQKFIRFMLKKQYAEKFVEMTVNMSARKDVAPPELLKDTTTLLSQSLTAHKCYDGVMSDLPEWWANVFYPLDNALIFGTMEPQEFISEIKAKTIEYWKGK